MVVAGEVGWEGWVGGGLMATFISFGFFPLFSIVWSVALGVSCFEGRGGEGGQFLLCVEETF